MMLMWRYDISAIQAVKSVMPLICLMAAISLFTANPLLAISGLFIPPVLVLLLWRSHEPPALLFAAAFQWLQVYSPILAANIVGLPLAEHYTLATMNASAWLGFLAIITLALGMRVVSSGKRYTKTLSSIGASLTELKLSRVIFTYVLVKIIIVLLAYIAQKVPVLQSIVHALSFGMYAVLFLIFWTFAHSQNFKRLGLVVLVVEIVQGFMGFFGSFKISIFIFIVAYLTKQKQKTTLLKSGGILLIVLTLILGSTWQAVKVPYRLFMNQGEKTQEVTVSAYDQVIFLKNILGELDQDQVLYGLSTIPGRLGQLEYFGHTIDMIPRNIPHQDGRLWGEAFSHILKPRIFFPDKAAVSDSVRTNEFTGVSVAGADDGASIGLGYITESFVDFGPFFMFVPIFFTGIFWGLSYRLIIYSSRGAPVIGIAFASVCILLGAMLIEKSNIKIIGGTLMFLLVWVPFLRLFSARIWRFLCGNSANFRPPLK